MPDWRDRLFDEISLAEAPPGGALRRGTARLGTHVVAVCRWDFDVYGGSFAAVDADTFVAACAEDLPLVTLVRSGGTRLSEGMRALVGIPRTALALAARRRPHVCVVDQPTTGGVWVAIASDADLRIAVAGATVGFSGPRVVAAMTGTAPPAGSHTAASAYAAGLVDLVVEPPAVRDALTQTLDAIAPSTVPLPPPRVVRTTPADQAAAASDKSPWEQVQASRAPGRPGGAALIEATLDPLMWLHGAGDSVAAAAGRDRRGRSAVAVAVAARPGGRPTVAGYRLLIRAAGVAGRRGHPLVLFVDTPGADPSAESEAAGIAPAIADAMTAVLACPSPTFAIVHGEGGSGGALAAAVTDRVVVTRYGYFAALVPEGAAAALRTDPAAAAELMNLAPADLLRQGFADAMAPADPGELADAVAAELADLSALSGDDRIARRRQRWSARPATHLGPRPADPTTHPSE